MRKKGGMRKNKVSYVSLLLLVLLQIATPNSALNTTTMPAAKPLSYLTRPHNVSVTVGEPAVFQCGVPETVPNVKFNFYGSQHNYSLTCPHGHVEDIPQALYGSCEVKNGELVAVWTLRGTSFSDNGTRVMCQMSEDPDAPAAALLVYDNGNSFSVLIGCVIGAFFGTLLVAGLSYLMLCRSDSVQKCFTRKDQEDDLTTIVTKD